MIFIRERSVSSVIALGVLLCATVFAVPASGTVREVGVVVKQGDLLGGSAVSTLNAPFTDGNGRVGFVGALADAQRFVWWNDGPVFYSGSALPIVLTGGESTMGVDNNGGFIYSPSADGNDAVYTHGGVLLKKGDPIPPIPGLYSSFNSRPTMIPGGTAFWIGGTATTPTGSTSNRHLFKAPDPTDPSTIARVLGGGDVISGKTVKTTATNFDYWISDNGLHHIHVLDMDVALNLHVYLDGGFVAQEGGPTGAGDLWVSFDNPRVNDDGHYIFSADTDAVTTSDQVLVHDGAVGLREGAILDGVTLAAATVQAAAINNIGRVAHIWSVTSGEYLFYGKGLDLPGSVLLLATGDSLDVNGDLIPEYVLDDFNASGTIGPGLDLAEDGYVYVHVDVLPAAGGAAIQAVLRVPSWVHSPAAADLAAGEGQTALLPGAPNPFREQIEIQYLLADGSPVRLSVHDVAGRTVRSLWEGARTPGQYAETWDGRDAAGQRVPAGIYFIRLRAGGETQTQRVVLID